MTGSIARKGPAYSIDAITLRLLSRTEPGSWGSTAGRRWNSAGAKFLPCSSRMWVFHPSSMKILAFDTAISALALVHRMLSLSRSATI